MSDNEEQAALLGDDVVDQQTDQEWHSTTDPVIPQSEDRLVRAYSLAIQIRITEFKWIILFIDIKNKC